VTAIGGADCGTVRVPGPRSSHRRAAAGAPRGCLDKAMKPADSLMGLRPAARWTLYGTIALLVSSGLVWIVIHYASGMDDLARLGFEAVAVKVHGATAFAIMIATGAMSAHHVRRGWLLGRNR